MDKSFDFSRRTLLAAGAAGVTISAVTAGRAATFGNPDEPAEGAMVAETLNVDRSIIAQFPKNRPDIVPS